VEDHVANAGFLYLADHLLGDFEGGAEVTRGRGEGLLCLGVETRVLYQAVYEYPHLVLYLEWFYHDVLGFLLEVRNELLDDLVHYVVDV